MQEQANPGGADSGGEGPVSRTPHQSINKVRIPSHLPGHFQSLGFQGRQIKGYSDPCRSGQQILLGDKVVVKGERLGHVSYIGKLDFDFFDQIYIGVHLDLPGYQLTLSFSWSQLQYTYVIVGNSNGTLKGRRYFQCPPSHGVFVKPADVICVTGRKVCGISL